MNYSELVELIQDTTENRESSFVDNIPNFVRQAEERIFNAVQLLDLRRNVVGNFTAGNPYLKAPTDFLAVYSLAVKDATGRYHFLVDKDVNYIREAYPSPTDTGLPRHYGLFDENTFIIGPTPDSAYEVELHQFYYPESIVTAQTTWLGDNYPTVLLYGALVPASIYMKGDQDMTATYDKQFTEALMQLKRLGDGMNRRDAYRAGQVRVPVN